jgi:CRISPR-associated protein Csb1
MVSEIIGTHAVKGVKTSSRIDPARIRLEAGPLYEKSDGSWTLDPKEARKEKNLPKKLGKDGKPSEANHGNVTPSITDGGVTVQKIVQTTVISLPALRRLSFPLKSSISTEVDRKARVVLASLALCAASLSAEQGCDLRSRCLLRPLTSSTWELLGDPKADPLRFILPSTTAISIYQEAVKEAKDVGLPFKDGELVLKPTPQLIELVRKSQELASSSTARAEAGD